MLDVFNSPDEPHHDERTVSPEIVSNKQKKRAAPPQSDEENTDSPTELMIRSGRDAPLLSTYSDSPVTSNELELLRVNTVQYAAIPHAFVALLGPHRDIEDVPRQYQVFMHAYCRFWPGPLFRSYATTRQESSSLVELRRSPQHGRCWMIPHGITRLS